MSIGEILDQKWARHGLPGLVIFALFVLIFFLLNSHQNERNEWRNDSNRRSDQMVEVVDDLKDAIQDLASEVRR